MNLCKTFLASCLLIGSSALGQRLPVEIVPWEDIGEHLEKSEIVVVGLLDSFEPTEPDEDAADVFTPSRTLYHQMRKLRALGGMAIPGLDDGTTYSEKISIPYVETHKDGEYGLYRDSADFLERTGRNREALLMRREAVRLANVFGLFTHLPVEQSKLAVLLMRLGDKSGSAELADAARAQINRGGLPQSVISEINVHLATLQNLVGDSIAHQQDQQPVDLQPHMSMVIPIADLPWTTYLTLINPADQVKAGHLVIQGPSVEYRANEETGDITITLLDAGTDADATQFACSVDPGTYRLIHLNADAETKIEGEIQITWQDQDSSSDASVKLEAPESGVGGAIIQAGGISCESVYGVPMILQYVSEDPVPDSPPLRFICSHVSCVEVYQLDGTPLDIEAFVDGAWQPYSRNRLAK